jgi:hypothetical protein
MVPKIIFEQLIYLLVVALLVISLLLVAASPDFSNGNHLVYQGY